MNAANDAPAGSGPIAPESERVRWVYTRAPAIVAVVAAAVRLVYWLHVRANDPFYAQVIPNFDMYTYWTWGRAIAGGDWLSRGFTEGRPFFFGPLYPYLLGVVFSIFGENFDVVHGLQAAMGVAAPLFVWSMARRLFGAAEGLAAGLLAAVCGLLVFNEQLLLMEGVVVALHAAMLWCVVRSQFSSRRGWLWMARLIRYSSQSFSRRSKASSGGSATNVSSPSSLPQSNFLRQASCWLGIWAM